MELRELRTMRRENPIGIDCTPYFSWKITSSRQNVMQTAYQLKVYTQRGAFLWDSGRIFGSLRRNLPCMKNISAIRPTM